MMKKELGKAVKVSILVRYLHPSRLTSITRPKTELNHRLEDCIVIGMTLEKVNQRDQLVAVMKHDLFITHDGASEEIYRIP